MSRNWRTAALQCLFAHMIAILPFSAPVSAEENYNPDMGVAGAPLTPPEAAIPEQDGPPVATAPKLKKNIRKGNGADTAKEPVPNEKMTIQQVMSILQTTRDLSGRNLSGLNLIGLNMSRANLKGADLSGANLERADFTESNLERVNFKGANMKMTSLFQSAVTAADMQGTILDGAIWLDKQVCAKGSIGRCLEKAAADQPAATAGAAQAAQPPQPVLPPPPVQPLPSGQPAQAIQPPVPPLNPVEPPVPPAQPIQPPVTPAQPQQPAPAR